jgi:hypothetical protein
VYLSGSEEQDGRGGIEGETFFQGHQRELIIIIVKEEKKKRTTKNELVSNEDMRYG